MWKSPDEYSANDDLVQVLCEVTMPETFELPRACEMPVSAGDHAVGDKFVSVGWRDHEDESDWHVAGWEMTLDCWTDARCFKVIGWQPVAKIQ